MPDSLMYYEESFVVLPPDLKEQFLNLAELQQLLRDLLSGMAPKDLPRDLQNIADVETQVDRLIKTACDLDCGDRGVWQWYAVRLEKPTPR